ncbi:hypothetical protein EXS62_03265 [Candidatus Kaiserbacteria bacterium]|nr:hypothetical protein [Candidatus Kaiserbacteria bacterium]
MTPEQFYNLLKEHARPEYLEKINAARAGLKGRTEPLVLDGENTFEFLYTSWAAWCEGVVVVPLDTRRDTQEMRDYKRSAAQQAHAGDALILFTSGTTGHPKGARLTLQNLITNAEGIIEWLRITSEDRFLVQLPLHHINSTTFCLAALIAGASIALPPRYSHSQFWELAAETQATFTSLVPTIIFDQLNRTKEFAAVKSRLKLNRIQLGSAPVAASAAREFMRLFGIPLYQGYGQTETALRVTGMPMDLPKHMFEQLAEENSIGTPMSWAQVEIMDTDGAVLGEGEEGELVIKGAAVMQGYVGDEPAFRDGWFLTGDIGCWKTIEGRRFFFLKGRAKEIIIKGGVNISPIAVEDALKKISRDMEQAYAVGVADARWGEDVGAAVVWKDGVETARAMHALKLRLLFGHEALSAYETPQYLATLRATDLPTTSTGKVQRTVLRTLLAGKLEPLSALMQSNEFRFVAIGAQSPLAAASHALYNHCWQPLTKTDAEYKKFLAEYLTLGAIDKDGTLVGQIAFSYQDNKLSCVSICSAAFKPKPVPQIAEAPSLEAVQQYLLEGHDPVMNFHTKLGAELVEVTPEGRPTDASALGYTMLLKYPPLRQAQGKLLLEGPVSNQLIQAVRMLASDVGAEVYAVSRPGGLAAYLSNKKA